MNPMNLLQFKPAWDQFRINHPKLIPFLKAISQEDFMDEGTLVEITVTNSKGKALSSNIRIRPSDLEFFQSLKEMAES